MKISLSPELERLIAQKVSSGRYRSADEVVREGLELLQERDNQSGVPVSNHVSDLASVFDRIGKQVPDSEWAKVPADLSENAEHYLYGSPKTS